jgi:hypothetical protein
VTLRSILSENTSDEALIRAARPLLDALEPRSEQERPADAAYGRERRARAGRAQAQGVLAA